MTSPVFIERASLIFFEAINSILFSGSFLTKGNNDQSKVEERKPRGLTIQIQYMKHKPKRFRGVENGVSATQLNVSELFNLVNNVHSGYSRGITD